MRGGQSTLSKLTQHHKGPQAHGPCVPPANGGDRTHPSPALLEVMCTRCYCCNHHPIGPKYGSAYIIGYRKTAFRVLQVLSQFRVSMQEGDLGKSK